MDTKIIPNNTYTIGYIKHTPGTQGFDGYNELTVLATLNNDTAKIDPIKFTVLVNDTIEYFSCVLNRDDIRAYPRQDTPDTVEV